MMGGRGSGVSQYKIFFANFWVIGLIVCIPGTYQVDAAAPVRSIRASEAYGQADRQFVKNPIEVLVRSRPAG